MKTSNLVQALVTVFLILFDFSAILFRQVSHIVSFNASDIRLAMT